MDSSNTRKLSRGQFVRHMPCTSCESSDAMAVYQQEDGTYDATCFSCGHYDRNPTGDKASDGPAEVKQMLTVEQCLLCPQLPIESRGIKQETVQFYGVRSMLNGTDGRSPVAHLFPYYHSSNHVAFKKRNVDLKHFSIIGNGRDLPFFGQQLFPDGGRRLYITEGEFDALSLFQVLRELAGPAYRHLVPCVVSLPNGSNSVAKCISSNQDFLSLFEEIVLVFDQDEAGRKAVESACSILDSTKVKVAKFSEKDANDMLMAGKSHELKWAVLTKAQTYVPSGIATVSDLFSAATESPTMGRPWPWPTLTKLTHGRKPGIFLIGAGVGVGKTEFFHELAGYIVREERKPVGVFLFEEAPALTIRLLAGKMMGLVTHRPDIEIDHEEYLHAINQLRTPTNLVYTFDHKWDRDWESIFTQIKHIITAHDVKDIFIDPLTVLTASEDSTDRALHTIMDGLSTLTQDPYNAYIYVSSHLNEPPRDRTPHEEGGRVKESQFTGSRAMIRYSNYVFGLERNKQAVDVVERNTTTLRVLKDREYGSATGETLNIYYDHDKGTYREVADKLEF